MSAVTCTVENGIAQVRLNRPDKLNALDFDVLDELLATARRLSKDKTLRAVVIAGEGDAFSAGLDFAAVMGKPAGVVRRFIPMPLRGTNVFQEAPWSLRRIPVPVIAAVHGHCLGGGIQIALAADFRIAHPDANFSVLEGKWGLVPDMSGVQALKQLVGIDQAKRLTMTAAMFSGKEAKELGLVTDVDADPIAAATAFAEELATKSPDALAAGKRLFDDTWNAGSRRTFARERMEQLPLLFAANTKILREATMKKVAPVFKPRRR
jgi:enoyl-CoA hydratase/carnithine racemase